MSGAVTRSYVYAGFWPRGLAKLIDFVFLFLLLLPLDLAFHTSFVVKRAEQPAHRELLGLAVASGLWFIYQATTESSRRQATFGKRAVGILVTDVNGNRITFRRAAVRWAVLMVSFYGAGIGFLFALFTKRKQALHDLVAGTLVVPGTA